MAQNAFSTYLGFLIICLVIGTLVFYQYVISIESLEVDIFESSLKFNQDVYGEVLELWQERETVFDGADLKEYPDLFQAID